MAEVDHGVKLITDISGRELARVAGIECQRLQPIESTLPTTTELLADRAFLATQDRERFLLYFEFLTRWDPDLPWDLLAKSGLLSQREHLPTVCLVFVLTRRGYHSPGGQMRLEALGVPTQHLWFREICLWQLEPQTWWETVPGLMALYPLCRHGRTPAEAIRHAVAAIERPSTEMPARADIMALLNIFGELAFPQLDVRGLIGRSNMLGAKFIRSIKAEGLHESIGDVIRIRFGDQYGLEIAPLLEQIDDPERLRDLHALAIRCANVEEFRAGLNAGRSAKTAGGRASRKTRKAGSR